MYFIYFDCKTPKFFIVYIDLALSKRFSKDDFFIIIYYVTSQVTTKSCFNHANIRLLKKMWQKT